MYYTPFLLVVLHLKYPFHLYGGGEGAFAYGLQSLGKGLSSWWRHQMETFSALLAICVGNSPVTGEFPAQRPVTRIFNVFFDLRLNIRLSKQSLG